MTDTRTIPLTKGYEVVVDAADYGCLATYRWQAKVVRRTPASKPHICAVRSTGGGGRKRMIYMHREIIGAKAGEIVDHINRNPLDNRRVNLRIATRSGNAVNREYVNPTGFRGVHPVKRRFRASLSVDGFVHRTAIYDTPEDAAREYDRLAMAHHGAFAVVNFPTQPTEPPPLNAA
ncbi:HNH endonuclease [Brevundimonas sp.]|uniref:HNH endonuclease n=1 Tax=Brevundimonas sp. TaxID=1871086 RepID=UPI0025C0F46E|nr:HNH endonuclease [Brevundimonas sp.]